MTTVGTDTEGQAQGATDGSGAPTVHVSRTVSAPVVHVWEVLVSPAGSQALLGQGAVLGGKGEPYHSADGTTGVLRSYHPLEQLRVSWHVTPDSPPSIVELDLVADGDGTTRLELSQNHLWHGVDADELGRRWSDGLERLASLAESTA
jgi:uncharacterized protein YndB with AHSA1/START domain